MNKLSKTIQSLLKLYKVLIIMVFAILTLWFILIFGVLTFSLLADGQEFPEIFKSTLLHVSSIFALIWFWVQLKIITNTDLTLKAIESADKIGKRGHLAVLIKYLKVSFVLDILFYAGSHLVDWSSLTSENTKQVFANADYDYVFPALEFFVPNTYGISTVFIILLLSLLLKSWDESSELLTELDGVV